jgi:poly(3-hydroxybutyrate) depolymerase
VATIAAILTAIALPGFTPYATGPHGGAILTGTFPGGARPGYVYLPPGYDPLQPYPAVYLLHGMPGSPSEYLAGTDLVNYADDGISSGRLRPFIAVLPAAGPSRDYNGEWAGPWEREVVDQVVPFVDTYLPTEPIPAGRLIAGLSAGGYGAADIGLRNPGVFGAILSWSGYFHPLHDGPFKTAPASILSANDPRLLAVSQRTKLARGHVRFFLSSGPSHSHWFRAAETKSFAAELRALGLPVQTYYYAQPKGEWRAQLDAGLTWAFG